jgi:O-antigen ligase/Flp pilus assembly protein TadD
LGRLFSETGGLGWLDDAVIAGLALILAFAAFAFGAVHQWAYTLLEAAQFVLIIAWMARVGLEGAKPARIAIAKVDLVGLALPLTLFALLLVVQLLPLPPALLRMVSPATYQLYSESFPGWPETAPYQALRVAWSSNPRTAGPDVEIALPPVGGQRKVRAQAAAPPAAADTRASTPERPSPETLGKFGDLRWRSISIAPSVTWASLIEVLACGAMFLLVLACPVGFVGAEREADARFMRLVVLTLLIVGGAVAFIGLLEKATWNGRILWFYQPLDWSSGATAANVRASGPFVNPDHFANFLAMILPLAVVGALFPITLNHRERGADLRLLSAVVAFLMAAGIVMSLSRGAWIASVAGVCIGLGASFSHARERAAQPLRNLSARAIPFALAGLVIFVLGILFLIGPSGRSEAGNRIGLTISQGDSLGLKPSAWRGSLQMIREFPIFGVGLGCWPELFPRYQRAPWMPFYFRQPENDYLQFVAETGLAGTALALWFGAIVWRKSRASAAHLSVRRWPLFAGLGAGLVASLIHEFFDFSLHTPANAVLFSLILAAFLRLALTYGEDRPAIGLRSVSAPNRYTYVSATVVAASAAVMIIATHTQRYAAYPYDIGTPQTFADAEFAAINHPADSGVHLALAALMPPGAPAALRHQELHAAVWLNPNDPLARDVYARSLFLEGKQRDALEQVTLSVFHSPDLESHYYLGPRALQWLLPDEQRAIYAGFGQAIAAGYEGSAAALASFDREIGRYEEAAEVSAKAADSENDDHAKLEYLLEAGKNYALAQNMKDAQKELRAAIEIDPSDARPYRELMVSVFGPEHDVKSAHELAQEAQANGVDPIPMEQALADAALEAGDLETAETALTQMTKDNPTLASMMRLGNFYSEAKRYDRATIAYQRATEINPESSRAFFYLAQAEESDFDFAGANRDYAQALKLAPNDEAVRQAYLDLQQRTAKSLKSPPEQ